MTATFPRTGGGGMDPTGYAAGQAPVSDGADFQPTNVATQAELDAAVSTLTTALSGKQDASSAATDAELAAAVATINSALVLKQDAATAATDAELAAAVATINSALALKQDAATAATDAELAAHEADTTGVHGIADTSALVLTSDARLSDQRVPTDGSVTATKVAASLKPSGSAAAGTEALRALGTTAGTAAAGNDARLSDARTPTGSAGGVLSGTYPNPGFAVDMATQAELDAEASARSSADALLIPKSLVDQKGDLLAASANDTVGRLGVGADGEVLTADAASALGVKWAAAAGGGGGISPNTIDAKGDLLVGTADNTVARKAAGTNGAALVVDPSASDGLAYAQRLPAVPTGYYLHYPGFSGGTNKSEPSGGASIGPFIVPQRQTFDRISCQISTTGTGNVRLLIYNDDGAGKPGTLLLDAGTVSAATSGLKEVTISQTLAPGLYWMCLVNETSGALQWNALNGRSAISDWTSVAPGLSTGDSGFYKLGLTIGSPPNPFGAPSGPSPNPPIMGLRAA